MDQPQNLGIFAIMAFFDPFLPVLVGFKLGMMVAYRLLPYVEQKLKLLGHHIVGGFILNLDDHGYAGDGRGRWRPNRHPHFG